MCICRVDQQISDRPKIVRQILDLYDVRSHLVHEGEREVLHSKANETQYYSEALFQRMLKLPDLQISSEDLRAELNRASYGLQWPTDGDRDH